MTSNYIEYDPSTDTMYVYVRPGVPDGGADAGENLVIHYSPDDVPLGYEIDHASDHPEHIIAALKLLQANWPEFYAASEPARLLSEANG